MSVYALVRALSAIIFSPTVGAFIDSSNRLKVVRISIVVQRGAVASSCLVFWLMLRYLESLPQYLGLLLLSCLILFACVEKLCSIMNTIVAERDWVVVIGEEGGENTLGVMNSQMRRIDLFCKILSPLAIALINGWSSQIAVILTLVINVASVAVEYGLIATVYRPGQLWQSLKRQQHNQFRHPRHAQHPSPPPSSPKPNPSHPTSTHTQRIGPFSPPSPSPSCTSPSSPSPDK